MPLPTDFAVGDPDHAQAHNDTNTAVNALTAAGSGAAYHGSAGFGIDSSSVPANSGYTPTLTNFGQPSGDPDPSWYTAPSGGRTTWQLDSGVYFLDIALGVSFDATKSLDVTFSLVNADENAYWVTQGGDGSWQLPRIAPVTTGGQANLTTTLMLALSALSTFSVSLSLNAEGVPGTHDVNGSVDITKI